MNEALKDALAKIEKAKQTVSDLCDGRIRWTMSVPARPDSDPDLIIADALQSAKEALSALSALQEARPVAWVRRHPDGALTAEFLEHDVIEPARKNSGAWVPLYAHPQPAQQDAMDAEFYRICRDRLSSEEVAALFFMKDVAEMERCLAALAAAKEKQ